AVSDAESAGNCIHLVQLSPWPIESRASCANAWRFRFVAREARNFCWRVNCAGRSDQSISSNGDYLFNLSALLEGDRKSRRGARLFASRFSGTVPRMGTSMARSQTMERRNAEINPGRRGAAANAQLHLEKSIPCGRQHPIASTRGRGCCFLAAYTHLRKLRRP